MINLPTPLTNFQRYFPVGAVEYCYQLWQQHGFKFTIAKARATRLGDYKFSSDKGHRISVNRNLNPYAFTFTYLHEVAHLLTFNQHGRRKRKLLPHGMEWKLNFRELMLPVMNENVFPASLLLLIKEHMANPAAASCSDPLLMEAFRRFDEPSPDGTVVLSSLAHGETFHLNGRVFVKEKTRRTRALCLEVSTQRKYTVSESAQVRKV